LETIEQQLGIFAHLSLDEQRRFLLYTLDDADDTASATDAVITAWRNGDTASLEKLLSESYAQYPEARCIWSARTASSNCCSSRATR
jgi:uncharacterized protein